MVSFFMFNLRFHSRLIVGVNMGEFIVGYNIGDSLLKSSDRYRRPSDGEKGGDSSCSAIQVKQRIYTVEEVVMVKKIVLHVQM